MKFEIVGKSLILTDMSHKIYEGENCFDTVEIITPRRHDKCDLSELSFRFSAVSEDGKKSAVQILKKEKYDEDYVFLSGEITSDFSAVTGKITFMLTGIDSENTTAKFQSIPYQINDDLSVASVTTDSAEQLFNRAQLEVQKAIAAAERAESASQTPAPAEIYPATTTRLGGVKVDGKTITADEDGTISAADSECLKAEIEELKSIIGFTDSDIVGLHADFENNIFTHLAGASGKSAGSDFDIFPMYGGRKRCNVLDNGTITAYYGDDNFIEDGSNGQVMVYQPKFYYKVVPLKLESITNGCGYHLRSANYYISAVPKNGFKLHPAFYNENGEPVDYILFSAYEGSIFDISANSYLQNDEQTADFSADKLSSIAGVKPCSGKSQNLTRINIERLAKSRGKGWHCDTIKAESANQLLMIVEYACFNMQKTIGLGVTSIPDSPVGNNSVNTGATSLLGNLSGNADGTPGQCSLSYRGLENPWGNIWKCLQGANVFFDENGAAHYYICTDFNFAEQGNNNQNYKKVEFSVKNKTGNISAFGYSTVFDWIFIPSEVSGNSNFPVGDYIYNNMSKTNVWNTYAYGDCWIHGLQGGIFAVNTDYSFNEKSRAFGCRLIYVPTVN